jgi:PEP-CTERM motif-containing protein
MSCLNKEEVVMRVTSLKVFVRLVVFGLLLGASSTAYADTVATSSITFSNLQFTPATGTAIFTPSGASSRVQATNSFGELQDVTSTTVPVAQASAAVTFASGTGMASAVNNFINGSTLVSIGGCSCSASSFVVNTFTGTLLITGGQGSVDVTISGLIAAIGQVSTDEFGAFAFANHGFFITVNGVGVISADEILTEVSGPNHTGQVQVIPHELSRVITLQFGAVNTIGVTFTNESAAVSAVPEPATVVLLVSGLGSMIGILKKRRKADG